MRTNTKTTLVGLITGCSTGFGRSLAEHVLERGHRLVATGRKPNLRKGLAERGDPLILPLTIQGAEDRFGRYWLEGDHIEYVDDTGFIATVISVTGSFTKPE